MWRRARAETARIMNMTQTATVSASITQTAAQSAAPMMQMET